MGEVFREAGSPLLRDPGDRRLSDLKVAGAGDVCLVGVPWDWSTAGRPGARGAPSAIRAELYSLRTWAPGRGSEFSCGIRDYGDVAVVPGDWAATRARIAGAVQRVAGECRVLALIGGDHSITLPALEGLARTVQGRIGVLVLDAHYDLRSTSEGLTSGSWLWEAKKLLGDRLEAAVVGVADYSNPAYLAVRAREAGVRVVTRLELAERGRGAWLEAVEHLEASGAEAYYISIDVDHVDASAAPGVNSPTPGGLAPLESIEILWGVASKLKPVAVDVVEVVPQADPLGITAPLAARLLLTALHAATGGCGAQG